MNRYNKYDDIEAPWKNPKTRESLVQRIKQNSNNIGSSNQSLITQEKIAQQYYRLWLELPQTALLQKIAQHPLLNKKSRAIIDDELAIQKVNHVKWAAGGSAVTLGIYSLFFSRMAGFRNFFNNQNSWWITRALKKTTGMYCVFLLWVASLTSTYEKQMPQELQKKGLLKEYGILGKTTN